MLIENNEIKKKIEFNANFYSFTGDFGLDFSRSNKMPYTKQFKVVMKKKHFFLLLKILYNNLLY